MMSNLSNEDLHLRIEAYGLVEGVDWDLDEWLALMHELRSCMNGPGWHPMGIAPLDGRNVLVCVWYPRQNVGPKRVEVYIGGEYEVCTARYIGGEWMDDEGEAIDGRFPVTHWMPLPEPPKEPNENTLS